MRQLGCKATIDIGANDGYVDLSVEVAKVEYSFAFFYYNPKICEPHDQDDDLEMDDQDSEFVEFNEMVLAETLQQPQLYAKPLDEKLINWEAKNDLYKCL